MPSNRKICGRKLIAANNHRGLELVLSVDNSPFGTWPLYLAGVPITGDCPSSPVNHSLAVASVLVGWSLWVGRWKLGKFLQESGMASVGTTLIPTSSRSEWSECPVSVTYMNFNRSLLHTSLNNSPSKRHK